MKRVIAGLAVAAVAALTAPAASAHVVVDDCGSFTPPMPCGVCVYEGPVSKCHYW
jgi:hypothetical protein